MLVSLFGEDAKTDLRVLENHLFCNGFKLIAGIDEAGRGALAGPVVSAAVIFPEPADIPGINDSKKLTAPKREKLFTEIHDKSLAVGVGVEKHSLIDEVNILRATLLSMQKAVINLSFQPDYLLIDGNCGIPVNIQQKSIIKGDSSSISIAAASIVAKVTRDRLMVEYDKVFPGYGFAVHKGYGCASHLAAIAKMGPCEIHRKTFRGVKEHINTVIPDQNFGTML
jgi:ribonuclease HII